MSDGCDQRGRRLPAAGADWFRVDENRFETLVATSAGLASHLRFIDLSHRTVGTWGELFDGDEALVMARIVATDLRAVQAAFARDADGSPLHVLAGHVMSLAALLDGWLKWLPVDGSAAGVAVRGRIERLLARPLGEYLQWLLDRFGTHAWRSAPLEEARRRFDPAWFARPAIREATAHRSDREVLRGRFFGFVSAIERVQDAARELLPASLESQDHPPAAGLLMAFLQLYLRVQERINGFTARHADFYHDDVLRMRPRPALPDAVHLVCERAPRATREVVVPAGTLFAAGKDADGRPITFRSDAPLLVTDCRVGALLTLQLASDPLISPERELGYVTRAEAARLPWPPATPSPADAPLPHWPLFGGGTPGLGATASAGAPEDARIGLAIASPLLHLPGGEREIELTFEIAQAGDADPRLRQLAGRIGTEPRSVRRRLPLLFKGYLLQAGDLLQEADREDIDGTARRLAGRSAARTQGQDAGDPHQRFLVELAADATDRGAFSRRLGRLFARWLLVRREDLSDGALGALRETAARLFGPSQRPAPVPGDPLCLVQGPNRPERDLIFAQLFNSIFGIDLSGPSGWTAATDFFVAAPEATAGTPSGLRLIVRLRAQDPAVVDCDPAVHGAGCPAGPPMLRLRLRPEGRLHPYSLLEDVLLSELALVVRVQGVRDVVMHNQLGRIDPGKPFMPFGPLPTTGSYCVFGAPEAARKNVTRLAVDVDWSGLPTGAGGFSSLYAGYPPELADARFTATAAILRDGQWQDAGAPGGLALFDDGGPGGRLRARARWEFSETALRAHGRPTLDPIDAPQGARNGLYRIQFHGPAAGFGHAAYPGLLTSAVSANALRRGRHPRALPAAPYTPLVERLTLDYEARSQLLFGREPAPGDEGLETGGGGTGMRERVYHLHPFGIAQVHPAGAGSLPGFWPRFDHRGHLYIGLSGASPAGPLTLHFHLRDESAVDPPDAPPRAPARWACLASNQWHELEPAQVLSDTTCGFLTSGIVTLDVPARIDRDNTVLPAGFHWLRLSVDRDFHRFAGLHGVRAQALVAHRVVEDAAAFQGPCLAEGSVKEPLATVPGLARVTQVGASFGLRPAEDRARMRTRVGERLRHKQRASTAWDYERLVLEAFPSVLKVKCFPGLSSRDGGARPGDLLVVVVPAPPVSHGAAAAARPGLPATAEPHLNAVEIARIQEYLIGLASPSARIRVRNATYERIQVRCTVKLARGVHAGLALRRVNEALGDYLSPWREGGCQAGFDWTVRCDDVAAHLRSLDEVDFVSRLSLLQVACSDGGVHTLRDTARDDADPAAARARPRDPWSIAVPMREHMVTPVEAGSDAAPEPTGYGRLGIGSTFILGGTAP